MQTQHNRAQRFVYKTDGVCPPEIHFQIHGETLKDIRFVGGGCPGNALLVSRLLEGKNLAEATGYLKGIDCRNNTSCPDQLAMAIQAAQTGELPPANSFRLRSDPNPRKTIGFAGELSGNLSALVKLISHMPELGLDTVYCMGNLTGDAPYNRELIRLIRKEGILSIQGKRDWRYAQDMDGNLPPLGPRERDWLLRLPQVLEFTLGDKKGMAFYGGYIQDLPGYSDYEPFALEMNMVCDLTNFMQDHSVFPALEAMAPQFQADIIVFSQQKRWGHWQVAGKEFISIGPVTSDRGLSLGLLTAHKDHVAFKTVQRT